MNRLRIGYLTSNDPRDRRSWSGTHYYISRALQEHCGEVCYLGPIQPFPMLPAKICSRVLDRYLGKKYLYTHSYWLAKKIARIAERRIAESGCDLIFAPAGSTQIAFLQTNLPVIYLSDATTELIVDYYPEFTGVLPLSRREAEGIEQRAIDRADVLIYPSQWAAQSAIEHYHANPAKVHVVPFGANLEPEPERGAVLRRKASGTCRLLFVGGEWDRKGGEIAFRTLEALERKGVQTALTIVGCVPPRDFHHPRLTVIPYLNKNVAEERETLSRLYLDADFFLLPTRSECTAIVFCEASAFALPVISTDTGGVAGAVDDGENGYLLPIDATGEDFAACIFRIYSDQSAYNALRIKSRNRFEEHLNWESWGAAINQLLAGLYPPRIIRTA